MKTNSEKTRMVAVLRLGLRARAGILAKQPAGLCLWDQNNDR